MRQKTLREQVNRFNFASFHFAKSVRSRRYSGPHFPTFGLNNSEYGHFLRRVSG